MKGQCVFYSVKRGSSAFLASVMCECSAFYVVKYMGSVRFWQCNMWVKCVFVRVILVRFW